MLVAIVPPAEGAVAAAKILLVVLLVVAPQPVLVAHVVGHHVEDDIDAAGVAGVNQLLELRKRAHGRIALEEILRMILVIRRVVGVLALVVHLDAGHPDGAHAHAGQIVEVVLQALPVAAVVEVAVVGKVLPFGFPRRLVGGQLVDGIREAVREELIDVDIAPIGRAGGIGEGRILHDPRPQAIGRIVRTVRELPPRQRCHHRCTHQPQNRFHGFHRDSSGAHGL